MQTIELIYALMVLRKKFVDNGDYDLAARCKFVIEKLIDSLGEL